MMSLVEFCKNVPGDIFGASYSQLNHLVNLLISTFFYLKYHHRHNQMLQFWCADGSDSEEDKEELIEFEAMSINVSDSSGYKNFSRVAFVIIQVK